jgi:hypothetical protein
MKKIEDSLVLNLESAIPFKSHSYLDPGKLIKQGPSLPSKNENVKDYTVADGLCTLLTVEQKVSFSSVVQIGRILVLSVA